MQKEIKIKDPLLDLYYRSYGYTMPKNKQDKLLIEHLRKIGKIK